MRNLPLYQRFNALSVPLLLLAIAATGDGEKSFGEVVKLRFDITDLSGSPIDSIRVGESFHLNVYVQDIRPASVPERGVFSAFLDVFYNASLVSQSGDVTFGSSYNMSPYLSTTSSGVIENVGNTESGFGFGGGVGAEEFFFFRVPFQADQITTGTPAELWGGAADNPPYTNTMVFSDPYVPVLPEDIVYGRDTLSISPHCDFNLDEACDLADLNLLYAQGNLLTGVPVSVDTARFDLDGDHVLDTQDIADWLARSADEQGYSSPHRYGDTNGLSNAFPQSRRVDIVDFNQLVLAFSPLGDGDPTNGPFWDQGNFDGDDDVDIADFNQLAMNFSPLGYSMVHAIPEPSSLVCFFFGCLLTIACVHCRLCR